MNSVKTQRIYFQMQRENDVIDKIKDGKNL